MKTIFGKMGIGRMAQMKKMEVHTRFFVSAVVMCAGKKYL